VEHGLVTDRQKQTQTDTRTKAHAFYRACLASRGKNRKTKRLKSNNGFVQKYRETIRGIYGVSLEEEKERYGGKDLQKKESFKPGMKERRGVG